MFHDYQRSARRILAAIIVLQMLSGSVSSVVAAGPDDDARYVLKQGDTMTGGLLILNGNYANHPSADAGVLLEVAGTMSGRTIHAQNGITSSGALVIRKNATFSYENLLTVDTNGLVYDANNKRVGVGTATPVASMEIHDSKNAASLFITTGAKVGLGNTASLFFESNSEGSVTDINPAGLGMFGDGSLRFTGAGNLVQPDMVITDDGRVGIKTIAPGAQLDVSGAQKTELVRLSDTTNTDSVGLFTGHGSPEGNVTAQLGSEYFDSQSGNVYIKSTGDNTNSGWQQIQVQAQPPQLAKDLAKMTRQAAQTIPPGTFTKIVFDTTEYDTNGISDVPSSKFTVKKAGIYSVSAMWTISYLSNTHMICSAVFKNGVNIKQVCNTVSTIAEGSQEVNETLSLAVGDTLEFYVFQNEGTSQVTGTNGAKWPRMSVTQLN